MNTFTISNLLEWAVSQNVAINGIPALRHIDIIKAALVSGWYDERKFFSSKISMHVPPPIETEFESVADSILPRVLARMDICASSRRSDEKTEAIAWLLSSICKAMEREVPGSKWEPIPTGSAAECLRPCSLMSLIMCF